MTRVFVFGRGPLPWQGSERALRDGRRTWQVAQALASAGHEVTLLAIEPAGEGEPRRIPHGGVAVCSVSEHACHERPEWVARQFSAARADAVVAVQGGSAAIAVNHVGELPFWSDLEGDPMVDAQARAARGLGDWVVNEAYRKHVPVLLRSDRFSTRTRAHSTVLLGQLGMVGRLIARNAPHEFVTVLPEVIVHETLAELGAIERRVRRPGDPFYLLSSGAFRPWADLETLIEAVEMLMAESEHLAFAAVGGPEDGAGADYARLVQRVSESPFASRIDIPGWVDRDDLLARYARADAAIFVDHPGTRSAFGGRGRALEWMAASVPVVCTDATEMSQELADVGAALRVPAGRATALRDAIRTLMDDPEDALARGLRGRRHARENRLSSQGLAPLLSWAEKPQRAPAGADCATLDWQPGVLRQHAATVREHLATRGPAGTMAAVGRFAARRLKNGAARAVDRMAQPPEDIER